jgi:EAL domain-containing protein (putative c-di-GMP-specific phosphodiesterase class I)
LKQIGCRLALDDFGVGFSSMSHVKQLPVDYLKIDGSFISDLPKNPVDQHLVRAMVEIARGLKKRTVAEFVGSEETMDFLRRAGVDYAQGFYVGKPAAIESFLPTPAPSPSPSTA